MLLYAAKTGVKLGLKETSNWYELAPELELQLAVKVLVVTAVAVLAIGALGIVTMETEFELLLTPPVFTARTRK